MSETPLASKPQSLTLARGTGVTHRDPMRPMILAAAVALTGAAWAQTAISPEDLAALEALKARTGATPPALRPDELAELEAHRARLAAAEAAAQPKP